MSELKPADGAMTMSSQFSRVRVELALRLRQALPRLAARGRRPARRGPNIHASWPTCITAITSASKLFGLTISEGAVANALRRLETPLEAERAAIRETLRAAEVVWSDETTTRINGRLHWHWVFVTPEAVLHEIAPRRAKAVAEAVMGGHKPAVGFPTATPASRRWPQHIRSASPMCCAMYNTRSTAVTASSRRSWPSCWPGRSPSADDAAS